MSSSAAVLLDRTDSISYRSPGLKELYDDGRNHDFFVDCTEVYLAAIRKCDRSFHTLAHEDGLMFLLPVLEIHTGMVCGELASEDRWLRIGKKERPRLTYLVEQAWDALRMLTHDGAGPFDCFCQYDVDYNNGRTQKREEYVNLFRRFERVMVQIHRTEQLARDYLQAHVGWLSLEESRESIKQSKIALEESQRTKLSKSLSYFILLIQVDS